MCGIVGFIQSQKFSVKNKLLKSLKRLEYRGYDSVGFATKEGIVKKQTGSISAFIDVFDKDFETTAAIAHTRWATHGGVTQLNAHPHFNNDATLFVVHNGIIENYQEIKADLQKKGVIFLSQTDSEIIPHYFESQLKAGKTIPEAIQQFMKNVKGTYAAVICEKSKDVLYAFKRDSPLALGICADGFALGSDIYAFSDETTKAIFFEDEEYAVITPQSYIFYNKSGNKVEKKVQEFEWTAKEESLMEFEHYMIKEIREQPAVVKRLLDSFDTTQKNKLLKFVQIVKESSQIIFLASGSSYHAALIGCILLNRLGYTARANIASEAETFLHFDKSSVVIAISQSGETMDVIIPLRKAKEAGAKILSIVNVPYSTIQRWSDHSLEVLAGQEVCVAATKSFTNQVVALLKIASLLGNNEMDRGFDKIPERIEQTIDHNDLRIQKLAETLAERRDLFVLGRSISYPMAREIALKLKEISYIHAEGMMAGELKHGTIALIESGTPVISIIPNNNLEMLSSTKEVEARGAAVIAITNTPLHSSYTEILVPQSNDVEFSIYCCIIGHLLSYYIGKIKGCEIDKPRNLAKSVTVK
jgi:glucosamine--fructose-6-phosphate aminotransferase (isomerizing)